MFGFEFHSFNENYVAGGYDRFKWSRILDVGWKNACLTNLQGTEIVFQAGLGDYFLVKTESTVCDTVNSVS